MQFLIVRPKNLHIVAEFIGLSPDRVTFVKTVIQSGMSAFQLDFYAVISSLKLGNLCCERTIHSVTKTLRLQALSAMLYQ
ncbi:hypothetical protein EN45_043840 [Penicillium chrysogenum]|uniref:Uncharacterized protein n=1 Tax=Penicillium chrysogenum TaxID=5076 RepID=A0A167YJB2_PENCH|nr:hypothetical protein EN45_043840 [Penicillium chrysogenum]